MCVGPVRTQITNTEKMNNSEMSMQNIHKFYVCSSDEKESKRNNADESKLHVYSTDKKSQKGLPSMHVLWTIANQKSFI